MPAPVSALAVLVAAALLAAPAIAAAQTTGSGSGETGAQAALVVDYTVAIEGVPEKDTVRLLEETSQLVALADRPPATQAGLRRRADDDVRRLLEVLRSQGFYDAEITPRIDSSVTPAEVQLAVDTGVLYLLGDFAIDYGDVDDRQGLITDLDDLDLHLGLPAEGATVVAGQNRLMQRLAESGRPLAKVVDRKVTVDHADTTMHVELKVDPGPFTRFGKAEFRGLESVDAAYLQRLVPWRPGAVYDSREVERLRKRLWATDLFKTVTPDPADRPNADGTLPVTVDLDERPPRTISAGVSYSTDRGLGGDISWEHRNLFGQQEHLALKAAADLVEQSFTADFLKPHVGRYDQNALANGDDQAPGTPTPTAKRRPPSSSGWSASSPRSGRAGSGRPLDYSVLDDNDRPAGPI